MKRKTYNISTCICPDCGNQMYVPRKAGQTRNKGHQKNLWCPYCKEIKTMREYREVKDAWKNMVGEML